MFNADSVVAQIMAVPANTEIILNAATLVDILGSLIDKERITDSEIWKSGYHWVLFGRTMVVDSDMEYGVMSAIMNLELVRV